MTKTIELKDKQDAEKLVESLEIINDEKFN
jgi:hypothetical protein